MLFRFYLPYRQWQRWGRWLNRSFPTEYRIPPGIAPIATEVGGLLSMKVPTQLEGTQLWLASKRMFWEPSGGLDHNSSDDSHKWTYCTADLATNVWSWSHHWYQPLRNSRGDMPVSGYRSTGLLWLQTLNWPWNSSNACPTMLWEQSHLPRNPVAIILVHALQSSHRFQPYRKLWKSLERLQLSFSRDKPPRDLQGGLCLHAFGEGLLIHVPL